MSDVKVIERPRVVEAVPGRFQNMTKVPLHHEFTRAGQRFVVDLFLDVENERIVQRGVNMTTGKTVWLGLPEPGETSEVLP